MLRVEGVTVGGETADALREIARLHDCSLKMAAETVLERYAPLAKEVIESAQKIGRY